MPYWQRFPSPNFDVPALPQFEGATNIQPFTYRDGATFLEMIDDLRKWCDDALTEPVNAKLQEYLTHLRSFAEGWAGQLATHRSEVVALTEEMRETINDAFKIFDGINTKTGSLPIQEITGDDIVIQPQNTWPRGWPLILKVTSTTGNISFSTQYFRVEPMPYTQPNTEYYFFLLPYGENKWRPIPIIDTVNRVRITMFGLSKDGIYRAINYANKTNSELYLDVDITVNDSLVISKPITIDGGGREMRFGFNGGLQLTAGAQIKNVVFKAVAHRNDDRALIRLQNADDALFENITLNASFVSGKLVQFPSLFDIISSYRAVIRNIRGYTGGYFIFSANPTEITVEDCNISTGGGGIIINNRASNTTIRNCKFTYTVNAEYRGERQALRISGDAYDVTISGCIYHQYVAGAVMLDGAANYNNVLIRDNSFYGNRDAAIRVSGRPGLNSRRVTIAGNTITGAVREGLDVLGIDVSNIGLLRIDDCVFPQDDRMTLDMCIKITACPRARIRGCDIYSPRSVGIDISGESFQSRISDCVIIANHADTISAIRLAPLTILGTVVQGCTLSSTAGVLSFHGDRTPGNMPLGINTMYFGALVYAGTFLRNATDAEMAKVHFDISYIDVWPNEMQPPRKALPGSTYRNGSGLYVFVNDAWRKVNS